MVIRIRKLNEVPIPSQESDHSCICVLGYRCYLFLSTIFLFDFENVPKGWSFFSSFHHMFVHTGNTKQELVHDLFIMCSYKVKQANVVYVSLCHFYSLFVTFIGLAGQ